MSTMRFWNHSRPGTKQCLPSQGAEALAEMLKANTALKMLDIGGCHVKINGLLAIAACMTRHNRTLETIGLEDCQVQSPPQQQTVRGIASIIALNSNIKQLYLGKHGLRDFDFEVWPPQDHPLIELSSTLGNYTVIM
jgi:hypothetical protein